MSYLVEATVYLVAAILSVPVSRWLGFGSILGYLAAGIIIGPFGLELIADAEDILHFAELGVVFLLFIIGLELKPARLWVMRRYVFGLGSAQVLVSTVIIAAVAYASGLGTAASIVVGSSLALSSTAFVLQMLAEQKRLTTSHGKAAFSILLLQDLAVIPLIALVSILGATAGESVFEMREAAIGVGALVALIVGGQYLLRPVLNIVARADIPELFTATALLVVIGSALLMQAVGLSMVLGAFVAGMLLADSEYRHQLEADIAPFKGLLLGLFFIAVGMTVDLSLLGQTPGRVALLVVVLMGIKAAVLIPLSRFFGLCGRRESLRLAAAMSQGGEFAFVLFALATREGVIPGDVARELILVVTLSMLLTPFAVVAVDRLVGDDNEEPDYDDMPEESAEVLIAGFGRVGQIIGRVLRVVDQPFTALEYSAKQVNLVRAYGNKVHFGDATRLETLRAAGAGRARMLVIATAGMETSLHIAETAKRNFPGLIIVARARNRRHAHKLMDLGVQHIIRDTLLSSLAMSEQILEGLGLERDKATHIVETFLDRDERLLSEQYEVHDSEEQLIQSTRETTDELKSLLRGDVQKRD